MALTLSPNSKQIRFPDDFPDGRCRIEVRSEFPHQGLGPPLLRIAVKQGGYLISTDKDPLPKAVHEFGHAREQNIRRFVGFITIMPDPDGVDPADQVGTLIFENGTDQLQLGITPGSPIEKASLLTNKAKVTFGNVAPQRIKTEIVTVKASSVMETGSTSVPVLVSVESSGSFALGTGDGAFSDQLTLPVGLAPVNVVVQFRPVGEGKFTDSLIISAAGFEQQVVLLTGMGRISKRPVWLFPLIGGLILLGLTGLLGWWLFQKPENPTSLLIKGISATTIQLHYDTTGAGSFIRIIERSTDSVVFAKISTLENRQVEFADSGLQPNTRYWYRGLLKGRLNNSEPTPIVDTTTLIQAPPPPSLNSPENLTAGINSSNTVKLSWNDNSNNEQGFDIERSTDGINFSILHKVLANVTTFLDKNLSLGTYTYRVRAIAAMGKSAYSNTVSVQIENVRPNVDPNKPKPTPPPAPTTHRADGLILEPGRQIELEKKSSNNSKP